MDDQGINQAGVQKVAAAPFDEPADIILRSSDKVDFHVYSIVLSLASPFFKGTFTLPQPEPRKPDANVIDLAEDSVVIDKMLRFCYPGQDPIFENAKELSPVIDALAKYMMDEILSLAQKTLVTFSEHDPVRVFAISYRYRWRDMAVAAARHALNHALPFPYVDELDHVPTKEYHLLIDYHIRSSRSAGKMVDPWAFSDPSEEWWGKYPCEEHFQILGIPPYDEPAPETRIWFRNYLERLGDHLRSRPSSASLHVADKLMEVVFYATDHCRYCRQFAHGEFQKWVSFHLLPSVKATLDREHLDFIAKLSIE